MILGNLCKDRYNEIHCIHLFFNIYIFVMCECKQKQWGCGPWNDELKDAVTLDRATSQKSLLPQVTPFCIYLEEESPPLWKIYANLCFSFIMAVISDLCDANLGCFLVCLYISVSVWRTHLQVNVSLSLSFSLVILFLVFHVTGTFPQSTISSCFLLKS